MQRVRKPTYEELERENFQIRQDYEKLRHELEQLKRIVFGQKSERFVPNNDQLKLGFAQDEQVEVETVKQIVEGYTREKTKVNLKPTRKPLPPHLPRVDIIIEPEHDVTGWRKIGEEITEELDFIPGKFQVLRYIRPKYVAPQTREDDTNNIIIAQLPSRPIDKGIPSAGLLAHILISKFIDHLPYYRIIQQFKRVEVELKQSTINGWIAKCCVLLKALYNAHCALHFTASYLQADETTIRVLKAFLNAKNKKAKKGKSHKGYFWVYFNPKNKQVVFQYDMGRGAKYPYKHLLKFRGQLQTDAYKVYDTLDKLDHIDVSGCMAHVRRKFEQALTNDEERAKHVMLQMQVLYAIEEEARQQELSDDQRKELRQEQAKPVMDALKNWLDEQQKSNEVLPSSAIGQAITYAVNRWKYIYKYLENGQLEIDNNLVENAIRPVAIGRKNYLFAGSPEGAGWAAMIYTLIASAANLGHNPYEYLKDVLARLPDQPVNRIEELLPLFWQKTDLV